MENKIILELIKKDLYEILSLVETLQEKENPEQLLIDITISKAKTLVQEFELLQGATKRIKKEVHNHEFEAISQSEIVDETKIITASEKDIPFEEEKIEQFNFPETDDEIEVEESKEVDVKPETPIEVSAELEKMNPEGEIEYDEPEIIFENRAEKSDLEPETTAETELKGKNNEPNEVDLKTEESKSEAEVELEEEIEKSNEVEIVFESKNEIELKPEEKETEAPGETMAELPSEDTPAEAKKILGEQFTKEPSLHERLATGQPDSKIKGKPVTSIKSAIGLNDKFMYTRELFHNKHEKFAQTVDTIDTFTNLMEAIEYLEQNFTWPKNDISLKFMALVKKRFEN